MALPESTTADFGDAAMEYRLVLEDNGLFQRSDRGKLVLVGPEAPNFLHNLCTNDILNLPLGGGCEAFFTTATAKVVDHVTIYHFRTGDGSDALWIDTSAGRNAGLLQYLEKYHIAENFEATDRTADFAQFHLAGPRTRAVMETAIGEPIPELGPWQHMERTIGNDCVCNIRRVDQLGVPGFDVVCLRDLAQQTWDALVAAGAHPAGAAAYEILRVEAGTPVIGVDMDENRFVLEVGRTHAVSYSKGCYLGQEPIVMSRDRAGHVNRSLRGLKLADGSVAPPKSKLFNDAGQEVGLTTSSVVSPRFGPIALGYVRRGFEQAGTTLHIDSATGRAAVVADLPIT